MEQDGRKGEWAVADRVCLVTGANAGIGYHTALRLAALGAHVICGCRSKARGEEAVARIKQESGSDRVELGLMDLSSLESVRAFAEGYVRSGRPLHVLILNAGVMPMLPQARTTTPDGFELCFGTNYVGHVVLTLLLLPALKRETPSRVIAVSSITHTLGQMFMDDLNLEGKYTHDRAYTQSKFAIVLFANEFTRRYGHLGVYANSVCPGIVASDILKDKPWWLRIPGKAVMRAIGKSPSQGADTSVFVATSPDLEKKGGLFFEHGKLSEAHPSTDNEELAKDLWEETLRLLSERKFQMSEARRDAAVVTQRKPVGHVRAPRPSRHWIVYYMRIYGSVYVIVAVAVLLAVLLGILVRGRYE